MRAAVKNLMKAFGKAGLISGMMTPLYHFLRQSTHDTPLGYF